MRRNAPSWIQLNRLKLNHGCSLCINFLYFDITEMQRIHRISVYSRFFFDSTAAYSNGSHQLWFVAQIAMMSDVGGSYWSRRHFYTHVNYLHIYAVESFHLNVCQMQTHNLLYLRILFYEISKHWFPTDSTSSAHWKSDVCWISDFRYKTFARSKKSDSMMEKNYTSKAFCRDFESVLLLITCSLHLNNRLNQHCKKEEGNLPFIQDPSEFVYRSVHSDVCDETFLLFQT